MRYGAYSRVTAVTSFLSLYDIALTISSVYLCVTSWRCHRCVETTEPVIKQSTLHSSLEILVFLHQNLDKNPTQSLQRGRQIQVGV